MPQNPPLIFDAHLDLSMNAMDFGRDITRPIAEVNARERGRTDFPFRGNGTVSLPDMRRGGVGICVATTWSRFVAPDNPLAGWHSPAQAWAQVQGQIAWYRAMESAGQMVQIADLGAFDRHLQMWKGSSNQPDPLPVGYILSMECADAVLSWRHLEELVSQGVRAIGPAHYGPNIYANGTNSSGGLPKKGLQLLKEMQRLRLILDVTHLCDESFRDAVENFDGAIWASHSNCRALVPWNRQFTDEQIKLLIARDAVIGIALDAIMLVPGWKHHVSTPQDTDVRLKHALDQMDHICQIAGNALHIGIGTDLDGGFGREQGPSDLETIADLSKLPAMLSERCYSGSDIEGIMHGNFIRFLRSHWS